MSDSIQRQRRPFDAPEFKPTIPKHLLKDCDDQQKFLLERISVLIQQQRWQMEHLSDVHDYCSNINGKVIELEKFRQEASAENFAENKTKKWKKALLLVVAMIAYPVYLAGAEKAGLGDLINWIAGP